MNARVTTYKVAFTVPDNNLEWSKDVEVVDVADKPPTSTKLLEILRAQDIDVVEITRVTNLETGIESPAE
jgi:hypothetical protein